MVAFVGALIKSIFNGFKNSFMYELYGDDEKLNPRILEDSSVYIGTIFIMLIFIVLANL